MHSFEHNHARFRWIGTKRICSDPIHSFSRSLRFVKTNISTQRLANISKLIRLDHISLLEVLRLTLRSHAYRKTLYLNSALLSLLNTLHFILEMPNRIESRPFKHNLPLISGIPKIPPHSGARGTATPSSAHPYSLCTLRSGFSHFPQKSARYLEFQKSAFNTSAVATVTGAFTMGMNSEAFDLSWILGIPKIGTSSRRE